MRISGLVDSARGLVPHGHLCWAYEDRVEFQTRASEYMADVIPAGQWIEYVGSGGAEDLRAELTGLDAAQQVLDNGGIGISSVDDFYEFAGHSRVVDPVRAVAARVCATKAALAAGYTGFRAVVDATAVVRTPEQRAAFACFEYLIDRQMSVSPVSALCAYDARELGHAAVAEMACLHPFASSGSTSFQLYADQGADFALAGEIDLSCAELFATTLARTVPLSSGSELVVDGRGLEFIDHRGLLALVESARRVGATVVLLQAALRSTAVRLIEFLDLTDLRVEQAT